MIWVYQCGDVNSVMQVALKFSGVIPSHITHLKQSEYNYLENLSYHMIKT